MTAELVPLPPPPGFGSAPASEAERQVAGVHRENPLPAPAAVAAAEPDAAAPAPTAPPEWKEAGGKKGAKPEKRSKSPAPTALAIAQPAPAPAATPAPGAPTWEPPPLPPEGGAAAPEPGKDQGEWSYDVDKTGIAIGFDQTLESDKVRKAWAEKGGSLSGYEAGLGLSFMFLSKDDGYGVMTMSGTGFQASLGLTSLSMTPPDYETRGTKWTAWKMGLGMDVASFSFTSEYTPNSGSGGFSMTGQMTQLSLNGCIGFLTATGSFDSETEWSGFAVGLDWAPSIVKTTSTVGGVTTESDPQFNAAGLALNFESGSMKAMAETMAKEAHFKLRIFLLPPVKDMPLFLSVNAGWTWY